MNKQEEFIIKKTLTYEGGWGHHKKDRGGETYKGIARNFWPNWIGWKTIDLLKKGHGTGSTFKNMLAKDLHLEDCVIKFYIDNFYTPLKLKRIEYQLIRIELFDTAVNCGKSTAVKCLQEACNVFNRNGKTFDELKIDGRIGNKTFSAVDILLGSGYSVALDKALNCEQYIHYKKIINKNPSQEVFFKGWMKRISY